MANVSNGSRTMAIEVCFSFIFAFVFAFNQIPVPPSKTKSIGDVLTNRQNAATWYLVFLLFQKVNCLLTHRIILRYQVIRGEQKKNSAKLNFENYRRCKFGPCCLLVQGASLSPSITQKTNLKSETNNLLRLSYSWGHCLKIVLYLAETEIY